MGAQFEQAENLTRRSVLRSAVMLGSAVALETITGCGVVLEKTDESARARGEFSPKPTWEQDFSRFADGPVNPNIWTFETNPAIPGYNEEAQGYTTSQKNTRIKEGKLIIEALREPYVYADDPTHRYEITSGRIDTRKSLNFEYGKLEAEIRLPEGKGTWPAFWLLSANEPYTQNIPDAQWEQDERTYMRNGELDIMEFYGHTPGEVEATIHTYVKSQEGRIAVPDATSGFHRYGIEVAPDAVTWTLDGKPYYQIKKPSSNPEEWPFGTGNKLYAILNLAMGGTGGGDVDPAKDAWQMEVNNVRFYDLAS